MHILFIAPANSVHSFRWINYFAETNCKITWISLKKIEKSIAISYPLLRPTVISPTGVKLIDIFLACIYLLLKNLNNKYDLIHAHSAGPHGLLAALSFIKPLIVTTWGSDVLITGKSRWKGSLVKFILRTADYITCDAHHMVKAIMNMGIANHKIHIINFGIDTKRLLPEKIKDYEYGKKFNKSNDNYVVISLRNHHEVYDIKTLILAIPEVIKKTKSIKFIIAGSGPLTESLIEMSRELSISQYIDFIGPYDSKKLSKIFSAVDIYVSTSLSDAGLSASTAEAMTCCVPVIISNTGENDLWIKHGQNGLLFQARDYMMLAENIVRLILNKDLMRKYGEEGRKTIESKNDYKTEMEKMNNIYLEIMKY